LARPGAAEERSGPPVQLADPLPSIEVRDSLAGLELLTLPDAHPNQPGGATDLEALTLRARSIIPGKAAKVGTFTA